jgi:hypothetical protein
MLLRDEPELLAIADALAATIAREPPPRTGQAPEDEDAQGSDRSRHPDSGAN